MPKSEPKTKRRTPGVVVVGVRDVEGKVRRGVFADGTGWRDGDVAAVLEDLAARAQRRAIDGHGVEVDLCRVLACLAVAVRSSSDPSHRVVLAKLGAAARDARLAWTPFDNFDSDARSPKKADFQQVLNIVLAEMRTTNRDGIERCAATIAAFVCGLQLPYLQGLAPDRQQRELGVHAAVLKALMDLQWPQEPWQRSSGWEKGKGPLRWAWPSQCDAERVTRVALRAAGVGERDVKEAFGAREKKARRERARRHAT